MKKTSVAVLILPAGVVIAFIFLYPLVYTFYLGFCRVSLPLRTSFAGLLNYQRVFRDPAFWASFRITLLFFAVALPLELVCAVLLALLLNIPFKGKNFAQSLLILPWAIPWVVNGILWNWILNPRFGGLNHLLYSLGLIKNYINWWETGVRSLFMVVLADLWKETPFISLLILTGLQAIPEHYYDAAKVDGANGWQRFWRITVPLLRPTIFFAATLRGIWLLKTFDLVYSLTQGGPAGATSLLNYFIYLRAFRRLDFGGGAACAVLFACVIFTLVAIAYKVFYREVEYA